MLGSVKLEREPSFHRWTRQTLSPLPVTPNIYSAITHCFRFLPFAKPVRTVSISLISQSLFFNRRFARDRRLARTCVFGILSFACAVFAAVTNNLAADDESINFANDIQTVLARRCYACHGPDVQEGSIRFDVRDTLLAEADSGEVPVIAGDSAKSELLRRITSTDESEQMPPEGKRLSEDEVAAIRAWIDQGAKYEKHWAFQPVQAPEIPSVLNSAWPTTAIDNFILHRLDSAGLTPAPPADTLTLIRRVYLDVTGIPPSPEEIDYWVSRWDETSYERLVDKLLADNAFGERWARTWLDVVRYAETNSFERDGAKPNAWKYRDYVIRAMNSDKPYSQFVREQIAGDELEEVTDDSLTATGYYRLGLWDDEPADPKQALFDGFDDLVTTTGQGIMGLTFNCARCHDHKIDPITQKDYYSLVAFLRDVTPYGTRGNQVNNNQVDLNREVAEKHETYNARLREIGKNVRKIEQAAIKKMDAPDQRATEGSERQATLTRLMPQYTDKEEFAEYQALKKEQAELRSKLSSLPPRRTVLGLAKLHSPPPDTRLLARGSPHAEGEIVPVAFPKLLGGGVPEIEVPTDGQSAGRRRVLADWLASKDNWMTARVIANRLWLHYFGRGIVRSPNNFGLMGDAPTHPELIEHLATQLMDHDWHLKWIHREILLSKTYRMSTQADDQALALDPSNNLFWRQNLKRLSAEQVRDSVLAVTGELNSQVLGPSMYPSLSAEVLASQSRPGSGWGRSSEADQARRSIYIHVKRSLPVPMMTAFDFPDSDISCEARFLTTQPGQALTMLNSEWMQQQAEKLYRRVEREVGPELKAQAERALKLCLCRQPHPSDVTELVQLVGRLKSEQGLDDETARRSMCLVAMNLNAFLYCE
jgi:mono/diheme cytochrome c family protein